MKAIITIGFFIVSTLFLLGQPGQNKNLQLHNGKGIYVRNGKYGFVNSVGKINYLYDSITSPTTDNYVFAMKGKHWGVIDFGNKAIVPFEYEQIQETIYKNQLGLDTFIVQKNGFLGTIDFKNKIVIPIKFEAISGFCETNFKGHYVTKNGKTGIVDKTGNIIIPTDYDFLYYYSKNTIKAKRNGKYGIINCKNEIVIPFEYDSFFYDHQNVFDIDTKKESKFVTKKNDIWYYLEVDGKIIQENVRFDDIQNEFNIKTFDKDFSYIKHYMITIK